MYMSSIETKANAMNIQDARKYLDAGLITLAEFNAAITPSSYQVYDTQTGEIMGTYQNLSKAQNKADKLDNEYGAYRYSIKKI